MKRPEVPKCIGIAETRGIEERDIKWKRENPNIMSRNLPNGVKLAMSASFVRL